VAEEPWQRAEIPGPIKAKVVRKPEVISAMIKRAKRPLIVAGSKIIEEDLGDGKLIDYVIKLAETAKIPVVATAHTYKEFLNRGFKPEAIMTVLDIGNRLADPNWSGLDGRGQYDLVLILGLPYYMGWVVLSSLKHFAFHLKTISLDRYYQPHASWSFPNLPVDEYSKQLKEVISRIGG